MTPHIYNKVFKTACRASEVILDRFVKNGDADHEAIIATLATMIGMYFKQIADLKGRPQAFDAWIKEMDYINGIVMQSIKGNPQ